MLLTIIIMLLALGYLVLVFNSAAKARAANNEYNVKRVMIIAAVFIIVACVISLATGRSILRLVTPDDFLNAYQAGDLGAMSTV